MENQINQFMQAVIPSLGYGLYNFSFLVILISQCYALNLKEVKINVGLIYILSFMYQAIALMFLFLPTALTVDMTLSYLFVGLIGGSVRANKINNPLKNVLLQLRDAGIMMKRDMIIAPINLLKNKLTELERRFYPEPKSKTEDYQL